MNNLDYHIPVLLTEVLQYIDCKDNEIYVDATFGAGGYSKALLESSNCRVIAFDRDSSTKKFANYLKTKFGDRFDYFNNSFSQMIPILKEYGIDGVDGIVYDLGVSSMQLDDKSRGFSFDSDAKLDMRMDSKISISAFEVVNQFSEDDLCQIIKEFGEERKARLIAKKIIMQREKKEIFSCKELADIVRSFYRGYYKIDPATKTFQAIRIFVNDELGEIKASLANSFDILNKGGRLLVVSFHALEDVIVKKFFKKEAGLDLSFSRYEPVTQNEAIKNIQILTKSAIKPSHKEIINNPRARSARLRAALTQIIPIPT